MATKVKRGFKVVPVTTEDIGAVVVRGPDWHYNDQDHGAMYGITEESDHNSSKWLKVTWYNAHHKKTGRNSYEWGERHDLAYYNPDDKYTIPGKGTTTKVESDDLPGTVYPEAFVQWILDYATKETINFTTQTLAEAYTLDVLYSIYKQEKQTS